MYTQVQQAVTLPATQNGQQLARANSRTSVLNPAYFGSV